MGAGNIAHPLDPNLSEVLILEDAILEVMNIGGYDLRGYELHQCLLL